MSSVGAGTDMCYQVLCLYDVLSLKEAIRFAYTSYIYFARAYCKVQQCVLNYSPSLEKAG